MSFWLWFLPNSAHSDGQVLFCMPKDSSHELRLHTFECNTLWPFAPNLHPESPWGVYCGLLVLGDCKYSCQLRLWPCYFPALCHCCLVSQHGTGIWNCFARKVAAYQLMLAAMLNLVNGTLPKLEPSLPEMMRTVFTTVLWAFGFDSYQTQLTLTGKCFFACREIPRNTWTETAHFWMQYTLTFCTHLAPRVTVGCVLWPPGARGLQIFMSASVVTMLFSQHVALCQCWLVSQHGTGIWNCFARKVATIPVDASW